METDSYHSFYRKLIYTDLNLPSLQALCDVGKGSFQVRQFISLDDYILKCFSNLPEIELLPSFIPMQQKY